MDKVRRKKRREHPGLRKYLPPILLILALAVALAGWISRQETRKADAPEKVLTAGTIEQRAVESVQSIDVRLSSGDGWYAEQTAAGILRERDGFEISPALARTFLSEAAVIGYEDIFTENPADYSSRLEEFGLSDPASVVTVTYTDGSRVVLRIGNRSTETEAAYYYMTVDGREPLYAISVSAAEDWKLQKSSLHSIPQPNLQTARMDHFVIQRNDGTAEWVLEADVSDVNASDAWVMVSPVHYPADGTQMTSLLKSIGNIRLGAYVAPASADILAEAGLDKPEAILKMHMAGGVAAVTGEDGTVSTAELEEESITLAVGSLKSEYVRYVRYENDVYLVSELTIGPVLGKKPMETVSRYPVLVAAEFLSKLTIEDCVSGSETVYQMQRETAEGEEVTHCFENGVEIPFETFQARYLQMVVCTVSGDLPEDYEAGTLKKIYTFEAVDGKKHSIRLYAYDSMHDALQVDEYPILFYLIQGGLGM